MSGHSKWSTIKREKGIKDAKRGAVFTRIGNQIAIAARGGIDPLMNSSLFMAIETAKQANMPAINIQRAIDRVSDKNASILEEIAYEAMGPGGIGIIIEAATDNRNRTFPEVKNALSKNGGRIADAGSVMFQFTRKGVIRVTAIGEDALLTVLDAGAEDAVEEDGELVVYTELKSLGKVRSAIIAAGLKVAGAELQYVPNMMVEISDVETAQKVLKLLDAIDEIDDVVNIHSNADITADLPE
ncbi:YebC/PmpR family DNA-binding transcriptional regulator [Candidatus Saccharibacteria bacterium CG11_big_fil_rev_8_21_14_0_20_41_19]|nr:YebC/PmpR family DNA-binding transcriptional regulator [Candidatus Saccharibacteria bacterium]OIP86051.1 MAG: transcriptional regulator [Candidatus Saccharibacteria bacterium CG2_30_41_52]PIQ70758.1 MAG: YebC/PmpR family DNA-binding transcriptional regulator [Candidatus Saccharibacteria bacterium CG11_big_fil_rev_8_21_14_0_20_41_19]PJC30029.1 MAG: YebC/PmpR family DNA-binding transcriptional regulator [Candidatus Saccharibacteria bacterium CG_4_9_14_0_2_um_filter_41_9]PJE66248.1 MAG: YebC/Pm